MHVLSTREIEHVSGGAGLIQTMGTIAVTSGGAALGGYYGAMWLGATLGASAGPVGAVIGAVAFGTMGCIYYKVVSK